jgi:hypothetical protein
MADQIRKVDYFYVEVPDKAGEGARLLAALKEAGINLLNFTAFPTSSGRAQLDLVTDNADALVKAAKGAGLTLSAKKQAFFIQGQNRPGAAAEVLRKLADAKVNIKAANGSAGQGGFGMIIWVAPSDFATAAKALGV